MLKQYISAFICIFVFLPNLYALNLRKVTGIKGSVVNSMYQDKEGLMYIATNAGVCSYDGKEATMQAGYTGAAYISGTQSGNLFIQTLYGFKVIEKNKDLITAYEMFNNVTFSTSDSKGTIFLIQGNGSVYCKKESQSVFDNIIISDLISGHVKAFFVYENALNIVMNTGILRSFEIRYQNEVVVLNEKPALKIPPVFFCFISNKQIYLIDTDYNLQIVNLISGETAFKSNLKPLLVDKGKLTSGVVFGEELFIGTESGLVVIREDGSSKIVINKGIKCLMKDHFQSLIWIGTFDAGVYTYSYDPFIVKSNLFSDFAPTLNKPVTTITADTNELWLGTDGAGVVVINNYEIDDDITEVKRITVANGLPDNMIQALHKTDIGIWIACKTGLAYYSFKLKSLNVIDNALFKDIRAVHQHESELWLACYNKGIIKVDLDFAAGKVKIANTKLLSVNNAEEASNRFTAIYADNSGLKFINEGNGIYEVAENKLTKITSKNTLINYANCISAINTTEYLAASDFGIGIFNPQKPDSFVFLNNTPAKEIIHYNWDDYWISSDNGLILYNSQLKTFRRFDKSYGVEIDEYSKGASFYDKNKGIIYFGGINGFTAIKYNFFDPKTAKFNKYYDVSKDYMPTLYVSNFSLFGAKKNINEFINSDGLVLKSDENLFSITFNALDYINGNNYIYFYKIGENGRWINNGNSGIVSFTDISPGSFNLYVKYYNTMLNKESYATSLSVTVLPPRYRTVYAYLIYFVLAVIASTIFYREYKKRKQIKAEEEKVKAEQRRKEDIYEAKLDFFTDMAHEFCTPLTLISGPCNLILEHKNTHPAITKYAELINRNAKRMNTLIGGLMDFKQMESGHKQPEISTLNVSELTDRIIDTFQINASGEKINIEKQYTTGINWNSDEGFVTTILVNLISNAVKYSTGEIIEVGIVVENECLTLKITNKGKGIKKEDVDKIFNKYAVLDNSDLKNWKQTGLGLVITASMVNLLNGEISVESIPDETTLFTVKLPVLEVNTNSTAAKKQIHDTIDSSGFILPKAKYEFKEGRPTVAIIDDNPEMLWYICDLLYPEFNVLPISKSKEALETINSNQADIILCDLMMDELDGIGFTEILKSDKGTSHIPLVIVSAAHDIEVQTEAINAGAELFITKPFDNSYLKSAIKRLLGRKEDLKDYFASPLSAYELNMGKLQHAEHRKFLKKVYSIINKNIENEQLSPDFIAAEFGMSTRSVYRKLKEATDKGLLEIIQEGKLSVAENLLLKSKLTIEEIVFKSGFASKASFYRAFSKKYGCSPMLFIERNEI